MSPIKYRPEIDGLRAVAVIPVVLFHTGFHWIKGGFIGVDVFFVISGYLITSILLKEHDDGLFRYSNFWLRRVRRIFPALVVMLLASSVASYFMMFRGDLNDVGKHGISAILSFANITMWRIPGGYWGAAAEESLFLHTWSLSVEEQFYFVYPFLLALLLSFVRKNLLQAMLALATISFLLYLYGSQHYPTATFYLLPMRAWELAAGCLVAIFSWNRVLKVPESISSMLSGIGLAAIILSYVFMSNDHQFIGYLILPVIGSVLIILFCENNCSIVKVILASSPLVFIGKISYSLYLWHWPLLVMAKERFYFDGTLTSSLVILSIIVLISIMSYYVVERPTRHRIKILKPAFVAFAASIMISVFLYASHFAYDCSAYSKPLWRGQLYNVNPVDTWPDSIKIRMEGIDVPEREKSQASAYMSGGVIKNHGGLKPEIVVLGDSHVLMWSGVIDDICEELHLTVSFYGADGSSPFVNLPLTKITKGNLYFTAEEKYLFDTKRLYFLREWKPKIVILVARWAGVEDIKITDDILRFIRDTGAKIILIEQPPELFFGDKNALQYLAYMGVNPNNQRQYIKTKNSQEYDRGRELIRKVTAQYPDCTVIPVADVFYKAGAGVWVLDGSHALYIDDDHLSQDGALKLKERISEIIKNMLRL